jgi:hypothetical protein
MPGRGKRQRTGRLASLAAVGCGRFELGPPPEECLTRHRRDNFTSRVGGDAICILCLRPLLEKDSRPKCTVVNPILCLDLLVGDNLSTSIIDYVRLA